MLQNPALTSGRFGEIVLVVIGILLAETLAHMLRKVLQNPLKKQLLQIYGFTVSELCEPKPQ